MYIHFWKIKNVFVAEDGNIGGCKRYGIQYMKL